MRVIILLALLLAGCQTLTPNKAAYITSDTLFAVSEQVELAHARGHITDAEENRLINQLIDGQKLLGGFYATYQVPGCSMDQTKQECLQVVLNEIEKRLREAQQ